MLVLVVLTSAGFAQEGHSISQHASNNWSEYISQYEVQFRTIPASCFNNGYVLYAIVDKTTGLPVTDTALLRQSGLEQVRIYHEDLTLDSTRHRNHFYKGGWDTLTIDHGSYIVGVEGDQQTTIHDTLTYVYVDTNTVLEITTNYSMPQAAALSVNAYLPDRLGNLPSLSVCKNTGRVELKIKYGKFPYTVYVRPHGMEDSLYRVVTFESNQFNGNDSLRYDFKDYYMIDTMPPGDWDFYLVDGCGSGLPRTGAKVEDVGIPSLKRIEVYASSGNKADSNVVRINSVLDNPYTIYYDSLKKYMSYRIYLEGTGSNAPFRPYPWHFTNANNLERTLLLDTIYGYKYCDFYGQNLIFEYKFDMPNCSTFVTPDTFHYYVPNPSHFKKDHQYLTDSVRTMDSCSRVWYSHLDWYSIRYESYEPNFYDVTTDDDNIWRRYHYTSPIYWYYIDAESGAVIKIDTIDGQSNIATRSYFTYNEAYEFYHPVNPSFSRNVTRRLVGAKGCTLYESTERLYFDRRELSTEPTWNIRTHAEGHCCSTPRTLTLYEENSSEFPMDTVWIDLYSSPYSNFYNFSAVYDPGNHQWTVTKEHFDNTMDFEWTQDGRSFTLSEYCMPSGPYRFHIRTRCDDYYIGRDVDFPEIYRTELVAEPMFEVRAECSDEYIHCTQGKVVRVATKRDPHTGEDHTRIDSLTTYYEIYDGPVGGYEEGNPIKYMLKDSIRISMPGRYILRTYPKIENGQAICEEYEYFDTIYYNGNAVQFDYALALLCDENSTSGTAYVHAKGGTPPYTYTLFSGKDLSGDTVMTATLSEDQIFIVPSSLFEEKGIVVSPHAGLSCQVRDDCGSYFQINFFPQILSDLQKTWFDGGLKADTTCEGTFVHINALSIGDQFQYEWSGPDGFYANTSNPNMFIRRGSESGWYKVVISNTGCENDVLTDSIYLGVKPAPLLTISGGGLVCPGEEVELSFVPTPGDPATPIAPVNFIVAFESASGIMTKEFFGIQGGEEVWDTYIPTSETKVYPLIVEDAECAYHFADTGDTVTLRMRHDVITPCNIVTTHDMVCYGGDGHVTATLELAGHPVDSNHPTHVRWFADYEMTHMLKGENLTGGFSYYDTADLLRRTYLYVSVNQDNICPSLNGLPTSVRTMENGVTTNLQCADVIRFFDPGGIDGDYPPNTQESYSQTFTSVDGRPVAVHFNSLELAPPSRLFVFTGSQMVQDSLLYTFTYGSSVPEIIISKGASMTFMFSPGPLSAWGWDALVSPAPGLAIVDVLPRNIVSYYDELCQSANEEYLPPFPGWENIVDAATLNDLTQRSGSYTFSRTFSGAYGCDSIVTFTLDVTRQPLRYDTTVVVLNTAGGYNWYGTTYTETGQYFRSVPGTAGTTNCDSVDRLNLIVLNVEIEDKELCEDQSVLMTVSVETPNFSRDFEVKTAPGDVLCRRIVQTDGGISYSEELTLRPDSFLRRSQTETLVPLGVVVFADPNIRKNNIAIGLTDAYRDPVIWAREEVAAKVRSPYSYASNAGELQRAMYELNDKSVFRASDSAIRPLNNGLEFTTVIKRNAELAEGNDFQRNAPAAYYCYYYDPTRAEIPSDDSPMLGSEAIHEGWYLPTVSEFSLFRANRAFVNKTLQMLKDHGYNAELPDPPGPYRHTTNRQEQRGSGYWTSVEFWPGQSNSYNSALFYQAKGQINGLGSSIAPIYKWTATTNWNGAIEGRYVRAMRQF